jgi:hypothetical protein
MSITATATIAKMRITRSKVIGFVFDIVLIIEVISFIIQLMSKRFTTYVSA